MTLKNWPSDESQLELIRIQNEQEYLTINDVSDTTLRGMIGLRLIDLQNTTTNATAPGWGSVPDATYYCCIPMAGLKTGVATDVKATFASGTVTTSLYTTYKFTVPASATARVNSAGDGALVTTVAQRAAVGTDGELYAILKIVVATSANPTFTLAEVVGI